MKNTPTSASVRRYPVRVITQDGKSTSGYVRVFPFQHKDRLLRALKFLLGCWGLAALFLFVPGARFVLTPLFLVLGLLGAVALMRIRNVVSGGQVTCPACGNLVVLGTGPERWPFARVCRTCRDVLLIQDTAGQRHEEPPSKQLEAS